MYYSLLLGCSIVILIGEQLVLSISFPTDDLDSLPGLFDDSASSASLFNDDDELFTTTTAATVPNSCAAVVPLDSDLSLSQDETNLFSRREDNSAGCLPPVNIGADTLQLFEAPLDSLENAVSPLKEQMPNDPFSGAYPGLLPNGQRGRYDRQDMENAGYQPYKGAVRVEIPPHSRTCVQLTFLRGIFLWELCCDDTYSGFEPSDQAERNALANVDFWSKWQQDVAVIYNCICTFLKQSGRSFFLKVFFHKEI